MSENVFREILGESLRREFAEFDNAPEHKFSLKHRLAMKRIFSGYEKKSYKTIELSYVTMPHYRLKQRLLIALVIVILMTLITGWFFPLHRITEPQINWLRSRYDFPNMKLHTLQPVDPYFNDSGYEVVGVWKTNDDYLAFQSDLADLGIYTAEEIKELQSRKEPIDTRSKGFDNENPLFTIIELNWRDETPISNTRRFVSHLEDQIDYYTTRSKDKSRAVEGDAKFAALIRENFLPLHKSYLELLEKLYAEHSSDDDSPDTPSNILLNTDKDDRKYLFIIHELEKL